MIRGIEEICKIQEDTENGIIKETHEKFLDHLRLLQEQFLDMTEFLVNYFEYGNLKQDDNNLLILCVGILSDSIRKQRICVQLTTRGYYDEAANLSRHIMESSFTLIYLSKNKNSLADYLKQQQYERDKLIRGMKNPGTVFDNFKRLLEELDKGAYYTFYRTICRWSHTSTETLRSTFEFDDNGNNNYYFTRRLNQEMSELLFNVLFGFINEAFWDGFVKIFSIEGDVPKPLKHYKEVNEKASVIFNKFYHV